MMLRLRVGDDAERAVDAHDEEEPTDPWLAGTRRMAISSNHHE